MASSASLSSSSTSSTQHHRSRFGDTTLTKVFVGGLAWETPSEELRKYFDKFGDILEVVVIADKSTGRSKGYGFVTFQDAEAANRSVADPNPVIDGRRANCNIAAMGRQRPSPPQGSSQSGSFNQSPRQPMAPHQYSRLPAQMPPSPPPIIYQAPYGYMTYPADYGYQQAIYSPQMTPQYYQHLYGPISPQNVGPPSPYPYGGHFGYPMQSPRGGFASPLQGPRPQVFVPYPVAHSEGAFTSPSPQSFVQLQPPPNARQPTTTTDSSAPQQPSTPEGKTDQSPTS